MRKIKKRNKENRIFEVIMYHLKENIKIYFVVSSILIIGITLGVIFINNMNDTQKLELTQYINNFIDTVKENNNIDKNLLFIKSIKNNIILVFFMWFVGSTVVGIPLVLGVVGFRGFCLGYTISALIAVLGKQKGIAFFSSSVILQNLILIPSILMLAVSGFNLYKSILRDKRRENIKIEIIRHTFCSAIILLGLMISSFIEAFISTNIFQVFSKYV